MYYNRRMAAMAKNPNTLIQKARNLMDAGGSAAAQPLVEAALTRAPRHPEGNYLLGMLRLMAGDASAALSPLQIALAAEPANGIILDGLGVALLMLERYSEAEIYLRRAAAHPRAPAAVHMRLGVALLEQRKGNEALALLHGAAAMAPHDPDCQFNLARALQFDGQWNAANEAYRESLRLSPGNLMAEKGLAASFLAEGRYAEAAECLRRILSRTGEDAESLLALGKALFESGELDEAETAARRASEQSPSLPAAWLLIATIQAMRGDAEACLATLERGYAGTQDSALLGMLAMQYRQLCDWSKWRRAWQALLPCVDAGDDAGSPFWLLCQPTTPAQQLNYTRAWARRRFSGIRPLPPITRANQHQRIRLGYLSSDLHEHATAWLIAEVLECHDRGQFEVFAYSYGPEDHSLMRARLRRSCEHFVDIARHTDSDAARRIREDDIDILVDLKGYTTGDRVTILARRPCDIQITWLGYPGTLATPHVDYVIADEHVIPYGAEAHYSERVLRMPASYQPNDRMRVVAEPLSRAAYGLPEEAFVFCCFNQAYKITPEIFELWMRLLSQVSHSVLWLLAPNAAAQRNLQAAAQSLGIAPARIHFAPRLPNDQHLARYHVADLALDTHPYASHTTLSDALWCGCPAVAYRGATFASRVSASLLAAVGMVEWIRDDLASYEARVLALVSNKPELLSARTRLLATRDVLPLFDAERFTLALQAHYRSVLTLPR
jgi:predicted O-linked N-acetylglucosamine transferase (SPINDLY family)